ncbi:MAG: hypothetical protein R6V50_05000 [Thermoplasmatota archaeon]
MDDESNKDPLLKKSSTVKSHDEILELFQEIEEIEVELKNPNNPINNFRDPKQIFSDEKLENNIPNEEYGEQQKDEVLKEKKIQKNFFTGAKRKKPIKIKFINIFKKPSSVSSDETTKKFLKEKEKKVIQKEKQIDPYNTTFTLKLDSSGNLVGLDIKKPKNATQKRRQAPLINGKTKTIDSPSQSDVKWINKIQMKINRLLSLVPFLSKKKNSDDSKFSKVSGITKKLKGIFSKN